MCNQLNIRTPYRQRVKTGHLLIAHESEYLNSLLVDLSVERIGDGAVLLIRIPFCYKKILALVYQNEFPSMQKAPNPNISPIKRQDPY